MKNLSHAYPEPKSIFSRCPAVTLQSPCLAQIQTSIGAPIEIEFISDVGWCFEVRYDLLNSKILRQPFTGEQEILSREPLILDSIQTDSNGQEQMVTLHAGEHSVSLNLATGSLITQYGGRETWSCGEFPFFSHKTEVEILEDMQSIERPWWDEPTPWRLQPTTFNTRMSRFRYTAPSGPIFGLPGQTGEFNKRGYRYQLFNTDQFLHIPSRPEMYQSWPIIFHKDFSGGGWLGVFHDNPSRTFVDLGDFYKEQVVFESATNNTRVYILHDSTMQGVSSRLVKLLGRCPLPPAWGFGYQQCRYSYMTSQEVRSVAARLRENNIPCDAIHYDIDYMDGYRVFTNDPKTFPDLKECIQDLAKDGFRSVCIIDPGVKIDPDYEIYNNLIRENAVLKNSTGEPFEIVCWPGKAVLPDFYNSTVRSLWASNQKDWLSKFLFDGLWNDMNEPSNFDGGRERVSTATSSEGPVRDLFNLYGFNMARSSMEGWRATHPNKRGIVITRSGYPGVQKHAVIWHGDNSCWWEHLRLAIDTCIGYSLCGAFYTGPDIPGFFGNPPEDLAIRAFQLAAFFPLYRGHSYKLNSHKEPYAFGPTASQHIKAAIELRYSLVSEWYSRFERCVRLGVPPMQPLFTSDGNPMRDSFLLFEDFLVVGVTSRDETTKAIWLPEGVWYRLGDTSQSISGGRWILEPITLEKLPVFVRGGTVLVRNSPGKNVHETLSNPNRFEIYRDAVGKACGYIYSDDGISIEHRNEKRTRLVAHPSEDRVESNPLPIERV